jgi:hypothetical protein
MRGILSVQRVAFATARDKFLATYKGRSKYSIYGPRQELDAFDTAHPGIMLEEIGKDALQTWIVRPLDNGASASWQTHNKRLKS